MDQVIRLSMDKNAITKIPIELYSVLFLQGNQISKEEIDWLIKAMPSTQIRY